MSLIIPFSEACERNKDPILEQLSPYLTTSEHALEIGTGTGQHVVYFAAANPNVRWQPTDQREYLEGIRAQLQTHGAPNIQPPEELDVTRQPWLNGLRRFDLIYSANTLHIMPWPCVEAFFSGLATVMATQAIVFVYGPFKFGGQHISASNAAFDQSLQARGVGSGVRDFEAVDCLAQQVGLRLLDRISMPANNHCLIWRRLETES